MEPSHLSCKVPNEMPPLPTRLLLPSATENHPFSWTPEHCWSDLLHTWSTWSGECLCLALDVPIYTDVFPLSNQTISSWVKGSSYSSILPTTHPPTHHGCIFVYVHSEFHTASTQIIWPEEVLNITWSVNSLPWEGHDCALEKPLGGLGARRKHLKPG